MIRNREQLQRPKAYVASTCIAIKTSKIQDVQDTGPLPVPTNKFIVELTVSPSEKLTEDTQIKPPFPINNF